MGFPKAGPFTVRESAELPAAGAYDSLADVTVIDTRNYTVAELYVSYTNADPAGQAKFIVYAGWDPTDNASLSPRTVDDGSINASANESYSNLYISEKKLPASPTGDAYSYTYIFSVATTRLIAVAFAEVGSLLNPGTLSAQLMLGGSAD